MARVTQQDLARLCGVDASTVSRAMSGDPRVLPETRARISEAAQRLGYRPNLAARTLVGGRSQALWFIAASLGATADWRTVHALSAAANDTAYDLFVTLHGNHEAHYRRRLERLAQGLVDGAVILPRRHCSDERLLRELVLRDYPLVFIDAWVEHLPVAAVTSDNAAGARELVRCCAEAGAREFLLMFAEGNPVARERATAAREEVARLGLPWTEVEPVHGVWSPAAGGTGLALLASSQEFLPLFASRHAEHLRGRRLWFGCFDEWRGEPTPAECVFVAPQDHDALARAALERLIGLIERGEAPEPRLLRVPLRPVEQVVRTF